MKHTVYFGFIATVVILSLYSLKNKTASPAGPAGKEKETEGPMDAYDALTFVTAMNAFPNADIPADGYAKAWQQHLALKAASRQIDNRSGWLSIGPNNIGGRTISIAIDPNDTGAVWLGSASGGLWRSGNGGIGQNAWQNIPTGFPVLGVGAIAINPKNSKEMFIGTGEVYAYGTSTNGLYDRTQRGTYGIGILKTTDGGLTWNQSLDWTYQQNRGVWKIIYNPANDSILYAATTEGVYKSIDDGNSWQQMLNEEMVMDLVINPSNPQILFAGVGNEDTPNKGIYRTEDGGTTWELLKNGLPDYTNDGRIQFCINPQNPNSVTAIIANRFSTAGVSKTGGVFKTVNNGDSWTEISTGYVNDYSGDYDLVAWQGWYCKCLLMKASDSNQVWAGGVYLYKSNDGGADYNVESAEYEVHSDMHGIISNPLDENKLYVITDGGLFRSNDFGINFSDCNDGYVTTQCYIGSVSGFSSGVQMAGMQDNYSNLFTGSAYWSSVIGGDGTYNAIDPADENTQYASSQNLWIAKTIDLWGYNSYYIHTSPSSSNQLNPSAFLAPFVLCPSNSNVLYGGTDTLIRSDDGGIDWTPELASFLNGKTILAIGVSATNPDSVYFATVPTSTEPMHIYRSTDGGQSAAEISGNLPNRYLTRITVNPHNSSEIYAVFSGFGGGHLFKSEDAGNTWTDISTSLPDLPFHCLAIDPQFLNNLYAGCDFGIYESEDGGSTWYTYDSGLPDAVIVWDLVVSPSDRSLIAFTHGHGVYINQLLNVTGIPEIHASTIRVFPNPVQNNITIQWPSYFDDGVKIDIYSMNGELVSSLNIPTIQHKTISLDASDLANGTYLLEARVKHEVFAGKFVVMK